MDWANDARLMVPGFVRRIVFGLGARRFAAPTLQRLYYLYRPAHAPRTFAAASAAQRAILDEVREAGFAVVPGYVDEAYCARCRADIDTMFAAHEPDVHKREDWRLFGAEHVSAAIAAFQDPQFVALADIYTGIANAMPFTLAARLADPASRTGGGGDWHRDGFMPELKAMLYLNDVGEENGAFEIVAGSHRRDAVIADMKAAGLKFLQNRLGREVDELIRRAPERRKLVTGRAGTLLVFDTGAIHRGTVVRSGARYSLTNYIVDKRKIGEQLYLDYAPAFRGPNDVVRRTTASPLRHDPYG